MLDSHPQKSLKQAAASLRRDTVRVLVRDTVRALARDTVWVTALPPAAFFDRIVSGVGTAGVIIATVAAWRSARLSKEQIELSRREQEANRVDKEREIQALVIELESAVNATIRSLEAISDEAIHMGREGRDSVGWVRELYVRIQRVERDVRDLLAQSARAHVAVSSNLRTAHGFIALLEQQLAQLVSRTHDLSSAQGFPETWRNEVLGVDRYHGKIELGLSGLRNALSAVSGANKNAQLPRIKV